MKPIFVIAWFSNFFKIIFRDYNLTENTIIGVNFVEIGSVAKTLELDIIKKHIFRDVKWVAPQILYESMIK